MDDFDNFFSGGDDRTPIYHTPSPTPEPSKKANAATIISICVAVFVCLVLVVNVIVLASLKDRIAEEYSASISDTMREEYSAALTDALSKTDIVDDVKNSASATAIQQLDSAMSEVVAANCLNSVVSIYCSSSQSTGTASGFVITGTASGQRYVVTNAHVVMYEKVTYSNEYYGGGFAQFQRASYSVVEYDSIKCQFAGEDTFYDLEVVAIGGIAYDHSTSENTDQADLALLRFKSDQPTDSAHPSVKLAASDYAETGDEIILIGNPQGIGLSMSQGIVSNVDPNMSIFSSSIVGDFIMTDAAVNAGNSGGPMINKNCVVIGVVESKLASSSIDNMGFAVSAATLVSFINWAELAENNELNAAVEISDYCTFVAVA